ncbi:YicC family protein [Priestia flexa]|uniref:YicC family protein n=1 Tax=Priestia flexa TaxID=86664 RepID=A0A8I1SLG3_9BACI|nr:YicC/YloC family endoribonuclease [Priestia flexa]MBN8250144.1 YicC family protein [Priestia flexa]MBN8434533.1 YicC family protein [Priestia flexa]MBY6084852.1 YicC family protein [Priestia flexa]MCA0967072.1 YicC family protein [Priestia flexa]UIR29060.1 YicC family protein [Priestia flexa]
MIRSMTGFGRGRADNDVQAVTVEMKSVNHRFCEITVRMPRQLMEIEDKIKKIIQTYIKRGRVEVFVTISGEGLAKKTLQTDWELLGEYMKAFQEISERHQLSKSVEIQDILHMPDVMTTSEEEVDQTSIHQLVFTAVEQAVGQLLTMREKEGQELYQDLVQHLTNIQQLRDEVESLAPTVSEQYEDRLRKRLTDYLEGTIDEQRVLAEVAIFAEKADVNEELTRIHSHLTQFFQTIDTTDVIGRKLDFLVQELNREMNTIGAKANNGKIAQCVIDMKTQLERLKEQVQNIE